MRRGFLNSKPAKEHPNHPGPVSSSQTNTNLKLPSKATTTVKSSQENDLPRSFPYAAQEKPVEVPKGHETKLNFVEGSGNPQATYIWTALPQVDDGPDTECLLRAGSKEVILKTPGFPKPLPPANSPPAFRVGPSPGKGMGLFSTRDIEQGETILWERPLLIVPLGIPTSLPAGFSKAQWIQHSLNEYERYVEVAVNRMQEHRRAAFMSLHNCHTKDGSGPLVGRVRTNGIGVDGLQPATAKTEYDMRVSSYSVISEHISRLNHSCSPNTRPSFDRATFAQRLYAVRDIAAGEELTFQYINVLAKKTERDEGLSPYAVVCACLACTEGTAESDKSRSEIAGFKPTSSVLAWAVNRQLPDDWLIKKYMILLDLIDKERLEHLDVYCVATRAIMESYICLGDTQNASKWAARVLRQSWSEMYESQLGVDKLLDPDSPAYAKHALWRIRVDTAAATGAMSKLMGEALGLGGW
ncbi:Aldehyde dehydrogenase [Mycena indigotica]|uniref:Aldehyde dehydrogenase n=1 Tax=Mycena indigotica TaxID=2126181 RepID=A0A8H6VRG2_9AGAR|nr:Aldehyde dehydrogenase [Mycena indigotica]KAF7289261.1 Aldehyde dehydrogenase [Mycena indigotica]